MKKTYLLYVSMFFSNLLFGQMSQNWNYQNYFNPATNGLFYKQEANLAYNFPRANFPIFSNFLLGSYATYLEKSKIGLGVNFLNYHVPNILPTDLNELNLKMAVNRQFSIQEDMILSAGMGVGVLRYQNFHVEDSVLKIRNKTVFSADLGLAFRYRRLNFVASANHFLGNGVLDPDDTRPVTWNAFASYIFGNREKIEIIPNVSFTSSNGFQTLQGMVLAQYKSKFLLGFGMASNDTWISTAGITLYEKYRISYSFVNYTSSLSNYQWGRHELGLAFVLNRRDLH